MLSIGCDSSSTGLNLLIDGLASPRGLSALIDGRLLISEGGAGRLILLDKENNQEVLYNGIPFVKKGTEGAPVGVSAAIYFEGIYYYIVGEARAKEFREVYSFKEGSIPRPLTGQDPIGLNPPNPIMNPYDILGLNSGGLLISDSGANVIWHVSLSGEIKLYSELELVIYNSNDGTAETQAVPTGMSFGPDGAVYVATLTGAPFPNNRAQIIRLYDINGDGDAMDEHETTVYATGFSAATDVCFLSDGRMLVTEYSQDMKSLSDAGFRESYRYPGRLVVWDNGNIKVLENDLVSPTSVVVWDNRIYVSEEFAGRVRKIDQ
jgi:hypothetical protein